MKKIVMYQCGICEKQYKTEKQALKCEKRGREKTGLKIGDIVTTEQTFGWYDGDSNWIATDEPGLPSVTGRHYTFYYVVTAFDEDPRDHHETLTHLETLAMQTGYKGGWVSKHHLHTQKAKNVPDIVKKQSTMLIGHKFENLL